MRILFPCAFALFFFIPQMGFSHEGHSLPGFIPSLHGGTTVGGHEINLEFVTAENNLKIYPLSHEGKDLGAKDVTVTATSKLPKEKAQNLHFNFRDGSFMTPVDFKKSFHLEIVVTTEFNHKKDTFKFQIEK